MRKMLLLVSFVFLLIAACGGVKPGVISNAGVVQYPLCEKAKTRVVDMRRASFELPSVFKQVQCGERLGFSHSVRSDSISVSISGSVANESAIGSGGAQTLSVTGGYEIYADYLEPEVFFVDYKEYLARRVDTYKLVTAGWVEWSGGRCARFYSDKETDLYLLRVLDYFCWESESGSKFPIHLHATQKQVRGQNAENLDDKFMAPVLSSLRVNAVSAGNLAAWSQERLEFCSDLKKRYDEKVNGRFADDLDRRRAIRYLLSCGYKMGRPVGVENWGELFMPDGKLIGQATIGDETIRRLSNAQFEKLKKTLMSLQPVLGERPEVTIQSPTKDGKRLAVIFKLRGPYPGEWYKFPPDYNARNGIGFRSDPSLGEVIDVLIRENARIPLGLKIVK